MSDKIKLLEQELNRMIHNANMSARVNGLTPTLNIMRHRIDELAKKIKHMKDEEHAGDFAHAARQSAKSGKTHFMFAGKKFPVTAKMSAEGKCAKCNAVMAECMCNESVNEASSHVAYLKPKSGAPHKDHFDLPVDSADHNKAHKKFTKIMGHSIAKNYEVVHVKPKGVAEEVVTEDSDKERDHTHAAHFHDAKGDWSGMALIHAKDDDDAIAQAHDLSKTERYKNFKLAHVEKHIPVKKIKEDSDKHDLKVKTLKMIKALQAKKAPLVAPVPGNDAIETPDLAKEKDKHTHEVDKEHKVISLKHHSLFKSVKEEAVSEGKEDRAAKDREIAIANIKAGRGTVASRKRLAAIHGVHPETGEPLSGSAETKPAAKKEKHDDDDYYMHHGEKIHSSEVDAVKAKQKRTKMSTRSALDLIANTRRMAAAKHATSGAVGGGSGTANRSPLEKAVSKIDKPKAPASLGASPAEREAEKAAKKAAEKKPKATGVKPLKGKIIGEHFRSMLAERMSKKKAHEELKVGEKDDEVKDPVEFKKVGGETESKRSEPTLIKGKKTATGKIAHEVESNPSIGQDPNDLHQVDGNKKKK